jgi:hypothetical protein
MISELLYNIKGMISELLFYKTLRAWYLNFYFMLCPTELANFSPFENLIDLIIGQNS